MYLFQGHDENRECMEIAELKGHSYYVATQFHPEYMSRPLKPSPPFLGLILASVGKLNYFLNKGCKFSPHQVSDNESGNKLTISYTFCTFFYYYNLYEIYHF